MNAAFISLTIIFITGIYKINRLNHIVIDEADTLFDNSNSFDVLDLLQSIYVRMLCLSLL